jgi:TonB family protein
MISALSGWVLLGMAQAGPAAPPPAPPPRLSPTPRPLQVPPPMPAPPPPPMPPGLSSPATPLVPLHTLFTADDYPAAAFRNEDEGMVGYRLEIGADGRVWNCAIVQSSGSASLDATTCRLFTSRARFTPARNFSGEPVPHIMYGRIHWRLEDESEPKPLIPTLIVDTIRADTQWRTTCWRTRDARPRRSALCPADIAGRLSSQAFSARATLEMTIVTTLAPAGKAEPGYSAEHGDMLQDIEASLGVGADGAILDCRVVRRSLTALAAGVPLDPCAVFAPGGSRRFHAVAAAGTRRDATVRIRTWIGGWKDNPLP